MAAVGFADLSGQLYWDAALPYTPLHELDEPAAPDLHAPLPRLPERPARDALRAAVRHLRVRRLARPGAALAALLGSARGTGRLPALPRNLLLVADSGAVARAFRRSCDVLVLGLVAVTVVLLVRKVRRASGADPPRGQAPCCSRAPIAIASLRLLGVADALGSDPAWTVLRWLGGIAFAAIPVAFLVGLLRTRLQRSAVADLVVELGSLPHDRTRSATRSRARSATRRSSSPSGCPRDERYVDPDGTALD